MFDISTISKRYFDIKLTVTNDNDEVHFVQLEVEPPKMKTLKKLLEIGKANNAEAINELNSTVRELLNKNKSGFNVPMEYIESLDFEQIQEILTAYFDWLSKTKNDPN